MELRVLQYFLAIAKEQSISGAAKTLHLSQPTLSRQMQDMEEKLGKQLFIRGSRKITLTEEGRLLRKRAEEILDLVQKTENEISLSDQSIAGDIYIGAGETDGVKFLLKAAQSLRSDYPDVHFHMYSSDTMDIIEKLDKGLIDFGLLFDSFDCAKYESLKVPATAQWGVLMQREAPLAQKHAVSPEDLWDKPLIISRRSFCGKDLPAWLKREESQLNVVATYSLLYNGSLMVEEGFGYALALDKIINVADSSLCFRPLFPKLEAKMHIIWKRYPIFTKAAEKFLIKLLETSQTWESHLRPD